MDKTVLAIETGLAAMQTWVTKGQLDPLHCKLPQVRQTVEGDLRVELRQLYDIKAAASQVPAQQGLAKGRGCAGPIDTDRCSHGTVHDLFYVGLVPASSFVVFCFAK